MVVVVIITVVTVIITIMINSVVDITVDTEVITTVAHHITDITAMDLMVTKCSLDLVLVVLMVHMVHTVGEATRWNDSVQEDSVDLAEWGHARVECVVTIWNVGPRFAGSFRVVEPSRVPVALVAAVAAVAPLIVKPKVRRSVKVVVTRDTRSMATMESLDIAAREDQASALGESDVEGRIKR